MAKQTINVPDIGGAKDVEIIEIYVAVGDHLEKEQALVALESDKASMDIPSPMSGKVTDLKIKVGDLVSEGSALIELEVVSEDTESIEEKEKTEYSNEWKPHEFRVPCSTVAKKQRGGRAVITA